MKRCPGPVRRALPVAAPFVVLVASVAHAADPASSAGNLSLVARAIGSLAGVVGLIVLLALLLRRFRDASRVAPGSSVLRSAGRLDLGARREIRLVETGGRTLVLGVTEQRIDLLAEMRAPAREAAADATEKPPAPAPALRVLRKLTSSS